MTNKEKLKSAMEQDINPKKNYNEIIKKIEKEDKMKINILKRVLVPISLMAIMSGALFLNFQKENATILKNTSFIDEKKNIILNINEVNNNLVGMPRLDADVKIITNNDFNFPVPFINGQVDLPKDLTNTFNYIFYTKENKESKEYNLLYNYKISYDNGNDRSIQVAYSKNHKPLRDYYFSDEGSKTTNINGVELIIYKFENLYFTEFQFNGYNFDIETSKITEQELSDFLLSILK